MSVLPLYAMAAMTGSNESHDSAMPFTRLNSGRKYPLTKRQTKVRAASKAARKARKINR